MPEGTIHLALYNNVTKCYFAISLICVCNQFGMESLASPCLAFITPFFQAQCHWQCFAQLESVPSHQLALRLALCMLMCFHVFPASLQSDVVSFTSLNFEHIGSALSLTFCHSVMFSYQKSQNSILQTILFFLFLFNLRSITFSNVPVSLSILVFLSNFLLRRSYPDCLHAVIRNETQVYMVFCEFASKENGVCIFYLQIY